MTIMMMIMLIAGMIDNNYISNNDIVDLIMTLIIRVNVNVTDNDINDNHYDNKADDIDSNNKSNTNNDNDNFNKDKINNLTDDSSI